MMEEFDINLKHGVGMLPPPWKSTGFNLKNGKVKGGEKEVNFDNIMLTILNLLWQVQWEEVVCDCIFY